MKTIYRTFLALALLAVLVSLGLTACEKPEPPPAPSDQPTNAAPAKAPDHPEHPK
jgi:hypothetical protein